LPHRKRPAWSRVVPRFDLPPVTPDGPAIDAAQIRPSAANRVIERDRRRGPVPGPCVNPPSRNFLNELCFRRSGQISGRDATCPRGTGACETAACGQRHVGVWPLFVGVSLAGGGVPVGHNRTRPPPCMRWRGPCSTCRSRLAGLPGSAGSGGPTAGASHPRPVPVSRFLPRPRSFPREVPVSDVDVFLLLSPRAAQASGGSN